MKTKVFSSLIALVFFVVSTISCSGKKDLVVDPNKQGETPENIDTTKSPIEDSLFDYSLSLKKLEIIKPELEFKTIALGRESSFNKRDGKKVQIEKFGICHPSIVFSDVEFNGYKYWAAMTPRFGVLDKEIDIDAFENPHIFCSKNGLDWEEPLGLKNPIDTTIKGPYNCYWSDPSLLLTSNKLYLYYRGCGYPYNFFGDKKMHLRNVVNRSSDDGINWSSRNFLYGTNSSFISGIDDFSVIASQSFIEDNGKFVCYEVAYSSEKNPYLPYGNQTKAFVFRREDENPNGSFGNFNSSKICSFENRPWGENNDPWHLEVVKFGGKYFMLLNVGLVGKSNGDSLWLAYSSDGKKFSVIDEALFLRDTYKSSMVPVYQDNKVLKFRVYQSKKKDGSINAYSLELKKNIIVSSTK
ncbi:hypothetical protein [Sphingobacterium multivorum]|uniref:hypothetical protein n=1 Tax=Sphingobacterium multivorum TaxID=28454 RepID=UPI0028AC0448|nr:hypothetical protein [Sphingobacterium multivorum]